MPVELLALVPGVVGPVAAPKSAAVVKLGGAGDVTDKTPKGKDSAKEPANVETREVLLYKNTIAEYAEAIETQRLIIAHSQKRVNTIKDKYKELLEGRNAIETELKKEKKELLIANKKLQEMGGDPEGALKDIKLKFKKLNEKHKTTVEGLMKNLEKAGGENFPGKRELKQEVVDQVQHLTAVAIKLRKELGLAITAHIKTKRSGMKLLTSTFDLLRNAVKKSRSGKKGLEKIYQSLQKSAIVMEKEFAGDCEDLCKIFTIPPAARKDPPEPYHPGVVSLVVNTVGDLPEIIAAMDADKTIHDWYLNKDENLAADAALEGDAYIMFDVNSSELPGMYGDLFDFGIDPAGAGGGGFDAGFEEFMVGIDPPPGGGGGEDGPCKAEKEQIEQLKKDVFLWEGTAAFNQEHYNRSLAEVGAKLKETIEQLETKTMNFNDQLAKLESCDSVRRENEELKMKIYGKIPGGLVDDSWEMEAKPVIHNIDDEFFQVQWENLSERIEIWCHNNYRHRIDFRIIDFAELERQDHLLSFYLREVVLSESVVAAVNIPGPFRTHVAMGIVYRVLVDAIFDPLRFPSLALVDASDHWKCKQQFKKAFVETDFSLEGSVSKKSSRVTESFLSRKRAAGEAVPNKRRAKKPRPFGGVEFSSEWQNKDDGLLINSARAKITRAVFDVEDDTTINEGAKEIRETASRIIRDTLEPIRLPLYEKGPGWLQADEEANSNVALKHELWRIIKQAWKLAVAIRTQRTWIYVARPLKSMFMRPFKMESMKDIGVPLELTVNPKAYATHNEALSKAAETKDELDARGKVTCWVSPALVRKGSFVTGNYDPEIKVVLNKAKVYVASPTAAVTAAKAKGDVKKVKA